MAQTALKYDLEVTEDGCVELNVPFPPGSRVTVFVLEESGDTSADPVEALASNTDVWSNTLDLDGEDWNH